MRGSNAEVTVATADTQFLTRNRRRAGFYPKGPGPNLPGTAFAFGIAPTIFATFILIFFGVDAGFYMDAEFVERQHNWLRSIAAFLTVPAAIAGFFVLRGLRAGEANKAGSIAILFALLFTILWAWGFTSMIRGMLEPVLRSGELATMIDAHEERAGASGLSYAVEGTALHVSIDVAEQVDLSRVGGLTTGPTICTTWGRVFTGPITVLFVAFRAPDGAQTTAVVDRDQCRSWYLSQRIPSNRPRPLLRRSVSDWVMRLPSV